MDDTTQARRIVFFAGLIGVGFLLLLGLFLRSVFFSPKTSVFPSVTPVPTITRRPTLRSTATRVPTQVTTRTPTLRPSPEPPYPTEAFTDQTGAEDVILSPSEEAVIEQKYKLRTSLPIKTATFDITYDYRMFIYTVTLHGVDTVTGKQQFAAWLKQNGYTVLTVDMFTFR